MAKHGVGCLRCYATHPTEADTCPGPRALVNAAYNLPPPQPHPRGSLVFRTARLLPKPCIPRAHCLAQNDCTATDNAS